MAAEVESDYREDISIERTALEPLATIELLITERTGDCEVHIRVDDTNLEPERITLPEPRHPHSSGSPAHSCPVDVFVDDIQQRLECHGHNLGTTRKWIVRDRQLRDIGLRLGRFLFGWSGTGRGSGNALHRTLLQLYYQASCSNSFISLCFHARHPRLDSLPWELTIWRFGGRDCILGTDRHLTFVRQGYYPAYFPPEFGRLERQSLDIQHITSANLASAHEMVKRFFEALDLGEENLDDLARYSHEWQEPDSCDIFHFVGHGKPGEVYWQARTPDGGDGGDVAFDVKQLIQQVGGDRLPSLIVLLACSSFDAKGWNKRGLLWDLLQEGVGAAIGMHGKAKISIASYFIQLLYLELLQHGRIDLAIQRIRWRMQRKGRAGTSVYHRCGDLCADWFRPILAIRDSAVLSHFNGLRSERLEERRSERLGHGEPTRSGGPRRSASGSEDEVMDCLDELLVPLDHADGANGSSIRPVSWDRLHRALDCLQTSEVPELEKIAEQLDDRWRAMPHRPQENSPGQVRGCPERRMTAAADDDDPLLEFLHAWNDSQWAVIVAAIARGVTSEEIDVKLNRADKKMTAPSENRYFGPYYYIVEKDGACSLVTTYGGEARGDWYWPYGDNTYHLKEGHILYESETIDYKGTLYRKVELSVDFFEGHLLSPAVPSGKPLQSLGVCMPYGSWDEYWEKIFLFSEKSSIRKAISAINKLALVQAMFPVFQGMGDDDDDQAVTRYQKVFERLTPLVHPENGEQALLEALDAATPAHLPEKLGDTTWEYIVKTDDGKTHTRTIWRWRLFFALTFGLAMKKLPA